MKTGMLQRSLVAAIALAALLVMPTVLRAAEDFDTLSWPRQLDGELGQILIYQPQFEEYSGNTLKARAAVSVIPEGETEPAFGAVWFDARLATDTDARIASLESINVTNARFPDSTQEELRFLSQYLEDEIPKWEMIISLDRLVAGMETLGDMVDDSAGLNHAPPRIIYATEPTVLVTIDGEPIFEELEGAELQYVVNTPFYVLSDPSTGHLFLRGGGHWYTASDIPGDWRVTSELPANVSAVADEIEFEERRRTEELAADPWSADPALDLADAPAPKIVVSTTPAEVVETDGDPDFAPIKGTDLLYLRNSESDIIMDIETQTYFILLAGRWYASDSLSDGNWRHVAPDGLPADFQGIPTDSDMATVRASVAGTDEAADAMAENLIPQTAEVDRHTAKVEVTYDGEPEFEHCTEDVAHAINTDKVVLYVDEAYYCCDDAVWFVSYRPHGPWVVATEVPYAIQEIPPTCPAYNVRYVYIYGYTPDVVYVGYTPAYLGSYIYRGCVVYGTGYWYRPWYRRHYYPRFVTWGYGPHWRPCTGWGFYFGVSFGWLDFWFGRPWYTGWWGPCGYVYGYRHGYHHGYYHGYDDGYYDGYHGGYHDGYWDSHYAGYHPGHHPTVHSTDVRNLFVRREKGIHRTGMVGDPFELDGGRQRHPKSGDGSGLASLPTKHTPTTPGTPPRKDELGRHAEWPSTTTGSDDVVRPAKYEAKPSGAALVEIKKPKTPPKANDVYAGPDGKVYQKKDGQWEKLDKARRLSPRESKPERPTRKELEKYDKARRRGEELVRKFKQMSESRKRKADEPRRSDDKKPKSSDSKRPKRSSDKKPRSSGGGKTKSSEGHSSPRSSKGAPRG